MLHILVVNDVATAPTVVFLHGLFGQGRNFASIAKALAPQLRSVLVDLPNHGRSDWTDEVDLLQMADEVALAITASASGPVFLVGHSLGGKVAMLVALRHPDLIAKLVVVDIAPTVSTTVGQFEQLLAALASLDLDSLQSRAAADEHLQAQIPNTAVRAFLLSNLHHDHGVWAWRANLAVLRRSLDVIGGFAELTASFDGPVLWVTGEHSDYVTDADKPPMRQLFPKVVHVGVKGAGHWVHSEQAAAFITILRRFLVDVPG